MSESFTRSRTLGIAAALAGIGALGGAEVVPREYQSAPQVPAGFGYRHRERPGGPRKAFAKAKRKKKIADKSRRRNRKSR